MIISQDRKRVAGFTLIELLVVLAIVAIMFGLTLGAIQKARSSAARLSCQDHLKQISLAIYHYESVHGAFPRPSGQLYKSRVQILAHLLPYVEQEPLWQATVLAAQSEPFSFVDPPHVGFHAVVPIYTCSADWRLSEPKTSRLGVLVGLSSYVAVATATRGTRGILTDPSFNTRATDVSDGLSNTLMMGERAPPNSFNAGWWYTGWHKYEWYIVGGPNETLAIDFDTKNDPYCISCFGNGRIDNEIDRYHFWSLHPGGANFSFGDGSVRFMAYSAAPRMPALASIAGGEPVSPD